MFKTVLIRSIYPHENDIHLWDVLIYIFGGVTERLLLCVLMKSGYNLPCW